MVNLVISKMETDAHTLRDIEKLLKRNSIVVQRQGQDTDELDTETLTEQVDTEMTTEEIVIEQLEGEPEQVVVVAEQVQELQLEEQDQEQQQGQEQEQADTEAVAPCDIPLPPSPVLESGPAMTAAARTPKTKRIDAT
jgi:brefeldin A-inhibited guanine nucleotide-exchange protein